MKISERTLERLVVITAYSILSAIAVSKGEYDKATMWMNILVVYVLARRNSSMDKGEKE